VFINKRGLERNITIIKRKRVYFTQQKKTSNPTYKSNIPIIKSKQPSESTYD